MGDLIKYDSGTPASTVWATSLGGEKWEHPWDMAIDSKGNIHITGRFQGLASFGTHKLLSKGDSDIFVVKLDSSGKVLWAKSAGGIGLDSGSGVALDSAGNVYVTGVFVGSAIFGPNALYAGVKQNTFIARLDPLGKYTWVTSIKATTANS